MEIKIDPVYKEECYMDQVVGRSKKGSNFQREKRKTIKKTIKSTADFI